MLGILFSLCAAAEQAPQISEPSYLDHQYMTQGRATLDDLARSHLGGQFNGNKNNDLTLLQQLLDRRLVRSDQKKELQAMGVIMGDLLAEELDLHWVIYEDSIGRSRALRYKKTENYLFPMTMISRRREAGNLSPVSDIYQRAVDLIKPQLPPLPFQ
ncbi:MAG: DUF3806 domain-containing protein [Proteobacteria bacterium]|nr:DUF3806 domain-containing protein [Pseudomonadota bacterium]